MTLTGPLDQCLFFKLLLNDASHDIKIGCISWVSAGAKKYKNSFLLRAGPLRAHRQSRLNHFLCGSIPITFLFPHTLPTALARSPVTCDGYHTCTQRGTAWPCLIDLISNISTETMVKVTAFWNLAPEAEGSIIEWYEKLRYRRVQTHFIWNNILKTYDCILIFRRRRTT